MRFSVYNLGCKVNSYEIDCISALFTNNGHVYDESNYDVIIVNTCAVTSQAEKKSRKYIRRFRKEKPNAIIVVMGCFSQLNYNRVTSLIEADIIIGSIYRDEILNMVKQFLKEREQIIKIDSLKEMRLAPKYDEFDVIPFSFHTRAYIKITDGCNNFCSYCVIPYTRGKLRSRQKEFIFKEIDGLVNKGYKEIVITGIHTGGYGVDLPNYSFSDLIEEILSKFPKLKRLRISSIEESEIDNKFINLIKNNKAIVSHLHIPLQSGSKTVLQRMLRKYNKDEFINKINLLRSVREDISITTDVICGFPEETKEEHEETISFIKEIKFSQLHVFPFSKREHTKCYTLKDVDHAIKKSRVNDLIDISTSLQSSFIEQFLGQKAEVLIEEYDKKLEAYIGHTSNYILVAVKSNDDIIGKIVDVVLTIDNCIIK